MPWPIGNTTPHTALHPALHNAYIDVDAHFGGDFGAALAQADADGGGVILLGDQTYSTTTGWSISKTTDLSLPIKIRGSGHKSVLATTSAVPILTLQTTTGNLRRLGISGVKFNVDNPGATGLKTRLAAYCQFNNLEFAGQGTGIDLGSGSNQDLGNQFSNIRMVHMGRGLLVNGLYNQFANLVVAEGLTGADAINIQGTGNVIENFIVSGAGNTGLASVIISGAATKLSNGVIQNSSTIGLQVTGVRYVKVLGVHILGSQTHGLQINGGLQGEYMVTVENSSLAAAGVSSHMSLTNNPTDNAITAQFVGTAALWDVAGSGTNNTLTAGTLPNGIQTPGAFEGAWAGYSRARVVATASLPVAAAAMDGAVLIEDGGAGDRNLIVYAGGQRFRIDGGANV